MSAIDRLLDKLGIKAPPIADLSQIAPCLGADYSVREFAREAAQRIHSQFGLDEDLVFFMIIDEKDPEEETKIAEAVEARAWSRQGAEEEDAWEDEEEEDEDWDEDDPEESRGDQ
jgi:hypothetical protein